MAHPLYTYTPPPQEQAFYDALFAAADKSSTGYLSGPTAVEFLSLSKLPVDLLKTIWSMADQNPTNNTLDKKKFYVAVRLIQLFQNGKKPVDLELNLSPEDLQTAIRPPYFEGVNVNAAASQQQPQQQQQPAPQPSPQPSPTMQPMVSPTRPTNITMNGGMGGQMGTPSTIGGGSVITSNNYQATAATGAGTTNALATQDPYTMTPQEQVRYDALFPTYASPQDTNYVHGAQAVELFLKSGMDRDQLKQIWTMCDDDPVDNKLDMVEFAIAMHLIVCITKKGLACPAVLPPSLVRVRKESRMQQQQPPVQNNMGGASVIGGGMSKMQQQQPQGGMMQPPPSPGGIPSPDKMPGMGGMQQGGQQMMSGGGMTMMPSPETQQPQMVQQQQLQQQQPQQMGMTNGHAGFGGGAVGGETVDDAFAGLSNDPVPDVDGYSTVGGGEEAVVQESMPAPPLTTSPALQPQMAPSPTVAPVQAPPQPVPSSLAPVQPVVAASMDAPKSPKPSVAATSGNASAELEELRAAHQKLQAEAVSLRAKAGMVSDEEQEAQAEIVKVASEIATLSTMLEELRGQVMESKVKLADAVATLKAQKEKKESLETAVEETRETYDALNSATEALVEANEDAMAHQAKAVAAAAAAKEEAEAPGADLFSWDSPAPAAAVAAPPVPLESEPMGQKEAPAPDMQAMGTTWGEQPGQPVASEPHPAEPAPVVADAGNVYYSVPQPPAVADAGSIYSTSSAQQSVTAGANVWGGANGYGGDMSQQTMPQQVPTNQYPNNMMNGMGAQPMQQNMMTPVVNTAAQPVQHLPTIESPTAEQIDQLKKDALVAEKSFRSSKDLVSTLKKEVKHLEAAAAKAEEEKKAVESKKKKMGGKKKQKKEIEKAYEFAMGEQKKVAEAREQLDAARRQSDVAKAEADKLRQQYEEAEVEAATAASYMSVNASNSVAPSVGGGSVVAQQQYQQQYQQPAPTNDAYADPFGMGASMGQPAAVTASDPYGMGLMGGSANGDYANPFAM